MPQISPWAAAPGSAFIKLIISIGMSSCMNAQTARKENPFSLRVFICFHILFLSLSDSNGFCRQAIIRLLRLRLPQRRLPPQFPLSL